MCWWTWAGFRADTTLTAWLTDVVDPLQRPADAYVRLRHDVTGEEWAQTWRLPREEELPQVSAAAVRGLKSPPLSPMISPPVSSPIHSRIRTGPVPRCPDRCAGRPNRPENSAGTHILAPLTGLRPFGAHRPSSPWSQTAAGQCGGATMSGPLYVPVLPARPHTVAAVKDLAPGIRDRTAPLRTLPAMTA